MSTSTEEIKKLKERIAALENDNQALQDQLAPYKSLSEELAAKRIFDLAYKRLTTYLTAGGLATILVGFFGYSTVTKFIKDQAITVAKKMDTKTITNLAKDRLDRQVAMIGKKELDSISHQLSDSAKYLFGIYHNKILVLNQMNFGKQGGNQRVIKTPISANKLQTKIDLSDLMGPVYNQGNETSGMGFMIGDALTATLKRQTNDNIQFSARYIYNSVNNQSDVGVSYYDALNLLSTKGAIPEKYWPYVVGQYNAIQPASANLAPHYKIDHYAAVDISIGSFRNILASNRVILAGMTLYSQYINVGKDGILPFYKPNFTLLEGRCVVITGYDDDKQLLKLRFSYGRNFGNDGYCFLHYSEIDKIITEAYVIGNIITPN